ncbi:MAG: 50S ribosomal protein L11 methyltransferase [Chitinophagaceae bacterium]|nr:MAG: 50S ribosomal protein L11 methyltransferase [Chitinophagaceae bacterium]
MKGRIIRPRQGRREKVINNHKAAAHCSFFLYMTYKQYHFTPVTEDQNDMLIALLSLLGFTGFEETSQSLYGFIPEKDLSSDIETKIEEIDIKYSVTTIDEKNWNEEWERGFHPMDIPGALEIPFVHIRAGFHEPCDKSPYELVVTPKMSFGTGHHETTYLMIQLMEDIIFCNKRVIDFGTGTGVLGILAAKMGAGYVLGIDNDEWSINNAQENVKNNDANIMELLHSSKFEGGPADVILANINLNIILENLEAMYEACKEGGALLISGLMIADEPKLREALKDKEGKLTVRHRGNWLAAKVDKAIL